MAAKQTNSNVIYWADDDLEDLELFRDVLQEIAPQYELQQFTNGKMLLEHLDALAEQDYPGLIILDMNMPVLDGRETLSRLKQEDRYSSIPKVVFTTSSSNMDKLFCDWMHTEMLIKPFTYAALKSVLQKLLSYYKKEDLPQ